jgi:hypothetical protein
MINNKLSVYDIRFNNENTSMYLSDMCNECISTINSFQAYILNKNSENIDFIEKLVYDLSKFYLDSSNKDIQNPNITIEFWFKANSTYKKEFHIDGDDNGITHRGFSSSPLCSILVYLNDNENPTLLTNIDSEAYKYKKITNKELYIIFPKKLKSIIFDGSYYHSEIEIFDNCDNTDRNVLVIDIWEDYIPLWLENYKPKYSTPEITDESIITIIPDNIVHKIPITNYNLDDNFFLDVLYKNNLSCCKIFRDSIHSISGHGETKLLNEKLYNGYIHIYNPFVTMKSTLERMNEPSYISLYDTNSWDQHISITRDFIKKYIKTYILTNFKKYGELNTYDDLFDYIIKNVASDICNKIKNTYSFIDESYKIIIQNIFLSQKITTNENNTIIASICLYDDFLFKNDDNEIIINSCSLTIQNSFYKNKCEDQIFIEFFIDIEKNQT